MRLDAIYPLQLEHRQLMRNAEALHDTLNNLLYEGKSSLRKNTREMGKTIKFFREKLFPHMNCDEAVIFPFIERHIPKYEQTIRFLTAEHSELRENFEAFECLYKKFTKEKNDLKRQKIIDKLRDKWVYLFCVIRNHLQAENESLYRAIGEQLRASEKKELLRKLKGCSCARNYLDQKGKNYINRLCDFEI